MPDSPRNPTRNNRSVAWLNSHGEVTHHEPGILPIYSIAKTMIASAIVATQIDLDAEIDTWISEKWLPSPGGITVRHLLHHSAGIKDYFMCAAYNQAILDNDAPWTDERYAQETLHQPKLFPPGTNFSYANPGYWLLKEILEVIHQQAWPEILRHIITDPLNMQQTTVASGQFADHLLTYDAKWVWHGVILSSALDVARFMASTLVTPLTSSLQKIPQQHPHWKDPHYGLGVMIEPGVMYGHNGGGPGYTAAAYHFGVSGVTGCVLLPGEKTDGALLELLKMKKGSE